MAIRINDNSSNFTGKTSVTISSFTGGLAGTVTSPSSTIDGSLQRALGSFDVSFQEGGWPLNGWALTGGYQISSGTVQFVDEPHLTYNAEKDVLIPQCFGITDATQLNTMAGWYKNLKTINPNQKILPYFTHSEIRKTASTAIGWPDINYDLVNDGTEGNTQWYLVDSSGNKVQAKFSSTYYRINAHCTQFQDTNSLGRTFTQQFILRHHDAFTSNTANGTIISYIDGLFADVVPPAPQEVYVDGDGTTETNQDFDRDGVADSRTDETDGAGVEADYGGARMHRRGAITWVDEVKSRFGPNYVLYRNGTRDGIDYDTVLSDPLENSEFYQYWGGNIFENAQNGLGIRRNGSVYDVAFDGFETLVKRIERVKTSVTQNHPWGDYGPYAIPIEFYLVDRAWVPIDYEYARFTAGLCVLCGVAVAHSVGKDKPFPRLDEYQFKWGLPINTHPNSGTLNTTTNAFTLRSPDFTSGVAKVMFVEFQNCLWVIRYDYPSAGAGAYGAGASVAIDLPNPTNDVTLKKWQFPDFTTTYTNPSNSLLQTRNQSPTINDGSDVTDNGAFGSISLPPAHARMLRRVNA